MSKKEHPYAQLLRWIADGETVELLAEMLWSPIDAGTVLRRIELEVYPPNFYRVKPRTIRIGAFDVPEPMRVAPAIGTKYFVPDLRKLGGPDGTELSLYDQWGGNEHDHEMLTRGQCHLTREGAQAQARALLSFTTQEAA